MSSPLASKVPPLTPARWLAALGLGLALLLLGMQSEAVFGVLTRGWQSLLEALGMGRVLAHVQQGTSTLVTTRSLPAMATYALLYVGLCLLLLHVLLRDGRRTRWAAQVYLGLLGAYMLLLLAGRLGLSGEWAYRLGRRIIDFSISPLPVMMLLPVLWPGSRRVL